MRLCSIPECGRKHYGQCLCAAHYQKFRKYGSPYFGIQYGIQPNPDGTKTCSICGIVKFLSDFYLRADTGNLTGQCKTCKAAKVDMDRRNRLARLRREKSTPEEAEKRRAYGRAKYEESKMTPTKFTARVDRLYFNKIKSAFGISKEEYIRLFESQDGQCEICGVRPAEGRHLAVDHDHATGKIRGLLCNACNVGLGYFKDSPLSTRAATAYLLKIK